VGSEVAQDAPSTRELIGQGHHFILAARCNNQARVLFLTDNADAVLHE
jgi:hypothetical protein